MVAPGPAAGPYANLFYPLSPRLTMLLCTMFTQGGQEDFHILDLLPDDDAYALQEKALKRCCRSTATSARRSWCARSGT